MHFLKYKDNVSQKLKIAYEKMGSLDVTYGLLNVNELKTQIFPIHCMCKNILIN